MSDVQNNKGALSTGERMASTVGPTWQFGPVSTTNWANLSLGLTDLPVRNDDNSMAFVYSDDNPTMVAGHG